LAAKGKRLDLTYDSREMTGQIPERLRKAKPDTSPAALPA
jgi:hypothetical protein